MGSWWRTEVDSGVGPLPEHLRPADSQGSLDAQRISDYNRLLLAQQKVQATLRNIVSGVILPATKASKRNAGRPEGNPEVYIHEGEVSIRENGPEGKELVSFTIGYVSRGPFGTRYHMPEDKTPQVVENTWAPQYHRDLVIQALKSDERTRDWFPAPESCVVSPPVSTPEPEIIPEAVVTSPKSASLNDLLSKFGGITRRK